MRLYVDDIRPCPEGFVLARSYEEAVEIILRKRIRVLSLDHDLGQEKSGYDLCKFLVENCLDSRIEWPDEIYLHTDNPVGRNNMLQLLAHYAPEITKVRHYPPR